MIDPIALIIPSFIAGVLTFLAPCTLPLVPGYLGFISGVSMEDLKDPEKAPAAKRKIFMNGLLFVLGFSIVFVLFGVLFGLGGAALASYQLWLTRIGGAFVILFGLFMMNVLRIPGLDFLKGDHRLKLPAFVKPGNPISSLAFGSAFAFGWTPCVGPVLGSILTLAASTATVGKGAVLLSVFSLGLAVPFLIIAASIGSASYYLTKFSKYLNAISFIGGIFLVFLGVLLITDNLSQWFAFAYERLNFINYDALLDYL